MSFVPAVESSSMRESHNNQVLALGTSDSVDSEKSEKTIRVCKSTMLRSRQILRVSIFSPNSLLCEFFKGIFTFQGYQDVDAGCLPENFLNMIPQQGHVVFLDGWYLAGFESDEIQYRAQEFMKVGVRIVVLADLRCEEDRTTQILSASGYLVLLKPLDYQQVVEVMAQV